MIKNIFSNRFAKAAIDILLFTGIFVSFISAKSNGSASWGSFHCLFSMTWYALMLVHIWQHWRFTKALLKPKVMKRNKIMLMTLAVFILMTFSVILFVADVSDRFVHFHHQVGHFFAVVMIAHTIQKAKRFVLLFKKKQKQTILASRK